MSECLTKRLRLGCSPLRVSAALLLALSGALSLGCNVFAPSALGGLTASREEKRVIKQAELDSFPSPADVGLGQDGDKP